MLDGMEVKELYREASTQRLLMQGSPGAYDRDNMKCNDTIYTINHEGRPIAHNGYSGLGVQVPNGVDWALTHRLSAGGALSIIVNWRNNSASNVHERNRSGAYDYPHPAISYLDPQQRLSGGGERLGNGNTAHQYLKMVGTTANKGDIDFGTYANYGIPDGSVVSKRLSTVPV